MESGLKSGAVSPGGGVCHACGYQYPNPHPSAKHRRAHRKNCGKTPAAAAASDGGSGDHDGTKLLLGEGQGGEGTGTGPSDSGGASPGSAQDVGAAVEDDGNAGRSSPIDAGTQVLINRSTEDPEIASEANETGGETEAPTQLPETAPNVEDSLPSQPAISCDQREGASASHRPSEPEDDGSLLSADEVSKSADVPASSATTVEEDSSVSNINAVHKKDQETESQEQTALILTDSIDQVGTITELVSPEKTITEPVSPEKNEDTEDVIDSPQETDSTSVAADQLKVSEQIGIREEQHSRDADVVTEAVSSTTGPGVGAGSLGENMQNEEIIAEASSHKISTPQSSSGEKEQIEEVITNADSDKIDVISSSKIVEEQKQGEAYVEVTHEITATSRIETVEEKNEDATANPAVEISMVSSDVELKKHDEETAGDSTVSEIKTTNVTDIVEEKRQNEEVTSDFAHAIGVVCGPDVEDKKQNEAMSDIVVHHKDNVEEKNEEATSDPATYRTDAVGTTDDDDGAKGQITEIIVEPTSPGTIVVHAVDNVEEKEEEPSSDPTSCKIDTENHTDDVEEKRQLEQTAADSVSHEKNTPQGTGNAEEKEQGEEPASGEIPAGESAGNVEEQKQNEETTAKEININKGTNDDQNEEVADKEMMEDSDKNHISLKALLSEKGAETKEKKVSTKDRVLSFRRKSSKDSASPVKPGSEQQDWNSPARLPEEKTPKAKKQQWMPFICCHSIN